jgi:hypothetical protein
MVQEFNEFLTKISEILFPEKEGLMKTEKKNFI